MYPFYLCLYPHTEELLESELSAIDYQSCKRGCYLYHEVKEKTIFEFFSVRVSHAQNSLQLEFLKLHGIRASCLPR